MKIFQRKIFGIAKIRNFTLPFKILIIITLFSFKDPKMCIFHEEMRKFILLVASWRFLNQLLFAPNNLQNFLRPLSDSGTSNRDIEPFNAGLIIFAIMLIFVISYFEISPIQISNNFINTN